MPRNGGGIFSLTSNYEATPGETILAEQHNDPLEDLEQDANTARPIVAGGTGAITAIAAHDNLSTKGADLPSAATTDIGAATGAYIHITGTTGITALGTKTAGVLRDVVFDGILTLTNSGTLILPGGANITTAVGDTARFRSEGGGTWRCLGYTRANGRPLTLGVRTITGNDSITIADLGKTILLNSASAATVTFSAVATLGDGFWCKFKNIGAGAITFDPNSSETIDGQTTSIVPTNDCGEIHCTGSALYTLDRPPVITLTSVTVSAGPVAIPLAAYISNGFSKFKLFVRRARPNTDGAYMVLDVSVNAGSSYVNSGYHTPGVGFNAGGVSGQLTTDQTTFVIADNTGSASGREAYTAVEFEITSADFIMRAAGENRTTAGDNRGFNYNGHQPTGSVNQIRFNFSTGGIASASYELVGIR